MKMKTSEVKIIQHYLSDKGLYTAAIDGDRGPKTEQSINQYLLTQTAQIPYDWSGWSDKRRAVATLQLLCHENDINAGKIDGLYGPQTEAASFQLRELYYYGSVKRGFDDIVPIEANPHNFPHEDFESLTDYYGPSCQEQPLVKVRCPWTLKLDWDLSTTTDTIRIHQKVADSLAEVLERVYEHYGEQGIVEHGLNRYGGSYKCRKKRGSQTATSTHAWGIAIDWFPSRNKLRWRSDTASLAEPELDAWWECWEREGWLSLGRTEDRDWMHVQAARR
jgi:hypothetical protein